MNLKAYANANYKHMDKTKRLVLRPKKSWLRQPRLFRLPEVLLFAIADTLDAVSYLRLVSTCKRIYRLTESDTLRANHAIDVVRILKLVFTYLFF